MSINLLSPTTFTTATLIADTVATSGGSVDSISTMTAVNGVPVNAALEIQSTTGALLLPRMTTTQQNALTTVVPGMTMFNSSLGSVVTYQSGAWNTSDQSITTSVTLTAFLGMYAAPIQILPAPGTGLAYVVQWAAILMDYGSAQLASGGAVQFQYANTVHAGGTAATATVAAATFTGITASTLVEFTPATTIATATWANAGLFLTNATGAFTTGTGASFKVFVNYIVVPST